MAETVRQQVLAVQAHADAEARDVAAGAAKAATPAAQQVAAQMHRAVGLIKN